MATSLLSGQHPKTVWSSLDLSNGPGHHQSCKAHIRDELCMCMFLLKKCHLEGCTYSQRQAHIIAPLGKLQVKLFVGVVLQKLPH